MPKLRRQRFCHRPQKDNIPLRLRWAPGVAGARRNPGREDRLRWNSSSFVSSADIDGYLEDSWCDTEIEVLHELISLSNEDKQERQEISVSLLDIARPAKVKGVASARGFEVVNTPQRVIALDDGDSEWAGVDEEDWVTIYAEGIHHKERKTYSAVLQGNDRH